VPPVPLRYVDSDVFLGWLKKEPDKVDECRTVIRGAEEGRVKLVTSSLTLVEVIKLERGREIPESAQQAVTDFFKHEWIIVRNLDFRVAAYARELIWKHNFMPKDSVHVATAVIERIPRLDTFDGELIRRSGEIGDPPLIIGRPDLPREVSFDDALADLEPDEE
jgi:predicted nucleic acid-binding protein